MHEAGVTVGCVVITDVLYWACSFPETTNTYQQHFLNAVNISVRYLKRFLGRISRRWRCPLSPDLNPCGFYVYLSGRLKGKGGIDSKVLKQNCLRSYSNAVSKHFVSAAIDWCKRLKLRVITSIRIGNWLPDFHHTKRTVNWPMIWDR